MHYHLSNPAIAGSFYKTVRQFLCGLTGLLLALSAHTEPQLLDRIVAIVEDDVVLASEVRNKMFQLKSMFNRRGSKLPSDQVLYEQVLERLILDSLQLQRAERIGLRISDQELNEAMARIAAGNGVSLPAFRQLLEQEGQSYAKAREETRNEMLIRRTQQRSVMRQMNISRSEIENFLSSEQGQSLLTPEFNIDHILLPVTSTADDFTRNEARQKVAQLKRLAEKAGDFKPIAEQLNEAGIKHSPLGWRTANDIPSLFEQSFSSLEVGEISDIIQSDSGFHLIKINQKRGGIEGTISETQVQHILVKTSTEIRSEAESLKLIEQIKQELENGASFAALARYYSDDPGSALSGGDLGWARPGDMVPEFEATMDATEIGATSDIFQSQFGWHILQVLDRRESDFSEEMSQRRARMAIAEGKYNEELNKWLQELRDDAFIEIK